MFSYSKFLDYFTCFFRLNLDNNFIYLCPQKKRCIVQCTPPSTILSTSTSCVSFLKNWHPTVRWRCLPKDAVSVPMSSEIIYIYFGASFWAFKTPYKKTMLRSVPSKKIYTSPVCLKVTHRWMMCGFVRLKKAQQHHMCRRKAYISLSKYLLWTKTHVETYNVFSSLLSLFSSKGHVSLLSKNISTEAWWLCPLTDAYHDHMPSKHIYTFQNIFYGPKNRSERLPCLLFSPFSRCHIFLLSKKRRETTYGFVG